MNDSFEQAETTVSMNELALNILDIFRNSITAGASLIKITLTETAYETQLTVSDNGIGIGKEDIPRVTESGFSGWNVPSSGLGLTLLKSSAISAGGAFEIQSSTDSVSHGTTVKASFLRSSPFCPPVGDIISTVCAAVNALGSRSDLIFTHSFAEGYVEFDSRQVRNQAENGNLGSVKSFIMVKELLKNRYKEVQKNKK